MDWIRRVVTITLACTIGFYSEFLTGNGVAIGLMLVFLLDVALSALQPVRQPDIPAGEERNV